ncbi:MAG: hypothetical protein ABIP81_01615 [Terriglobales bacterium]
MKRILIVILMFAFTTCMAFAQQKAKDAVVVDGNAHRVVLENEYIRVIEARASHGAKSPRHSHPPLVFISLDTARVKFGFPDGKSALFDMYPGQVLWMGDGMEHSWELLGGEVNVIGVEIKSALPKSSQPLAAVKRKANDSVTVDPDTHHVLFENDHVRVFDGRATKGRTSVMHSHPPTLLVHLTRARLRLTLPDGKTVIYDFTPGQVNWAGEGMEHSWEALSGEAQLIAVEVKSAQRAMPAKAN